jgi:hypothetical protein
MVTGEGQRQGAGTPGLRDYGTTRLRDSGLGMQGPGNSVGAGTGAGVIRVAVLTFWSFPPPPSPPILT